MQNILNQCEEGKQAAIVRLEVNARKAEKRGDLEKAARFRRNIDIEEE